MKARRRGGFTIVELLTVLAILSLLMALLAPAVQQARESARSMTCKSRLRALVTAVLQYEGVHGMLPTATYIDHSGNHRGTRPSVLVQLLPFLERMDVYEQINFDVSIVSTHVEWDELSYKYTTVSLRNISAFTCPSDGRITQVPGAVNYRANMGNGPMHHRIATFPDSDNGAFSYGLLRPYRLRLAHFIDGLGHTAAFSERLIGGSSAESEPTVRHAYLQWGVEALDIYTADDQMRVCAAVGPTGQFGVCWSMGSSWLASGQDNTLYAHCMPPNSAIIDCIKVSGFLTPVGGASARSMHPGKVNLSFLDGSVRSISDEINLIVWRALGSRDGQETVLATEF